MATAAGSVNRTVSDGAGGWLGDGLDGGEGAGSAVAGSAARRSRISDGGLGGEDRRGGLDGLDDGHNGSFQATCNARSRVCVRQDAGVLRLNSALGWRKSLETAPLFSANV
jgi:hypothetical protein